MKLTGIKCFYCGVDTFKGVDSSRSGVLLHPHTLTRDHVISKMRGGRGLSNNKVHCCLRCNQEKGPLSMEEYRAAMMLRAGLLQITAKVLFHGEKGWKR